MIRTVLLLWIFIVCFLPLHAQNEVPVLMRVGEREVSCAEFADYYKKLSLEQNRPVKEAAELYADYLLKVQAAEARGLDSLPALLQELYAYKRGLVRSGLTDAEAMEQEAYKLYEQLSMRGQLKQLKIQQICLYLPQHITRRALQQAELRMDSIHQVLQNDTTWTRFAACVAHCSDEKEVQVVYPLQLPVEFEAVMDTLKVGMASQPFFTPQGIHLVRLLEQTDAISYKMLRDELMKRLTRHYRADRNLQLSVDRLKEKYRLTLDKAVFAELEKTGTSTGTLFTLEGRAYDVADFARFALTYPAGISRQVKAFVTKSVLDYANEQLEQTDVDFSQQMRTYRDSLLVAAITRHEMGEERAVDEIVLQTYFEAHRKAYHWSEPRYRGIVLHATSKRMAKQVRKLLKGLPEAEWEDAIRLTVNAGGVQQVRAEQSVFASGDNPYVDRKIFKKKIKPLPDASYPFTVFLGRKVKGPEHFSEVENAVRTDYIRSLETKWIESLRAGTKVEIDQATLKTVNNQ